MEDVVDFVDDTVVVAVEVAWCMDGKMEVEVVCALGPNSKCC